jgi:hypothetical protein
VYLVKIVPIVALILIASPPAAIAGPLSEPRAGSPHIGPNSDARPTGARSLAARSSPARALEQRKAPRGFERNWNSASRLGVLERRGHDPRDTWWFRRWW